MARRSVLAAAGVSIVVGLGGGVGFTAPALAAQGPPPPATCFQPTASGEYPTCTLVDGTWVEGGDSARSGDGLDAALGAGGLLAILAIASAVRISASRRRRRGSQPSGVVPGSPADVISLGDQPLLLPQVLELTEETAH